MAHLTIRTAPKSSPKSESRYGPFSMAMLNNQGVYMCRIIDIWLVVEPYPSEKYMTLSLGMMNFPTFYGKS